jgi:predicted nucleic acid-binding protein
MLLEFVSGTVVMGIDDEICKRFEQICGSSRGIGRLLGDFDLLIAVSALEDTI